MYNLIFMEIFALAMAFPAMLTYIEFFYFIRTGKRLSLRMRNPKTLFLLNLPAALLLILGLVRNHRLLLYTLEDVDVLEPAPRGWTSRACCQLLKMTVFERTAVMVVLSLPVLAPLTKMFLSAGRLH